MNRPDMFSVVGLDGHERVFDALGRRLHGITTFGDPAAVINPEPAMVDHCVRRNEEYKARQRGEK